MMLENWMRDTNQEYPLIASSISFKSEGDMFDKFFFHTTKEEKEIMTPE
jgi:hypothetical protein